MRNVLKLYIILCVFISLPAMAFEGDYIMEERFQAYLFKAKDGEVKAQFAVGEMYQRGRGTEASDEDALYWFLLSASKGDVKAAYKAGYIYLHSSSVPQSPRKAVRWLKLAAKAGIPAAQYELGMIYGSGLGGFWDTTRALKLLAKAKLAGYKPADRAFKQVVSQFVKLKSNPSRSVPEKSESVNDSHVAEVQVVKARFRPNLTKNISNPKQMILARRWDSNSGPSAYLPSYITDCREVAAHIECLSNKLTKQVSTAKVVYRIRTRITDIKNDGHFRIAYANNVISATNKLGTKGIRIKAGWQSNEHTMECSLDEGQAISCSRGNSKQFRFTGH